MAKRHKWGDQPAKSKKIDLWNVFWAVVCGAVAIYLLWSNLRAFITEYTGETKVATVKALPAECKTGKNAWNHMVVIVDGQQYIARMTTEECREQKFSVGANVSIVTHRFFTDAVRPDIEQPVVGLLVSLGIIAFLFFLRMRVYTRDKTAAENREAKRQQYQEQRRLRKTGRQAGGQNSAGEEQASL